jgi:predicted esterase
VQLERVPVFVSHGINDPITPVEFARESRMLAQQHLPTLAMEYMEYPGSHSVNGLQEISKWLSARL